MIKNKCNFQEIQNAGDRILLNPTKTLNFEEYYKKIVAGNTLRAFHRMDRNETRPTDIVHSFLNRSKNKIINGLKNVKSTTDIDKLSDKLFTELKTDLEKNIKKEIIKNYNAVRKLIDLILEHITLLDKELNDTRQNIIQFLRVPLDSFILNSDCLFTYSERKKFELGPLGGGFLNVKTKEQYENIQNHLSEVTKIFKISYPIYFDVLWRDRIDNQFNLFS